MFRIIVNHITKKNSLCRQDSSVSQALSHLVYILWWRVRILHASSLYSNNFFCKCGPVSDDKSYRISVGVSVVVTSHLWCFSSISHKFDKIFSDIKYSYLFLTVTFIQNNQKVMMIFHSSKKRLEILHLIL